jgi:formate/nitrite transporter FocA (FNT family)
VVKWWYEMMGNSYIRCFMAGVMIGVAAIVSANANEIVSPFIFSIGLLVIIACDFPLFTGRIGDYDVLKNGIFGALKCLILNCAGAAFVSLYFSAFPIPDALLKTVAYKNSLSLVQLFVNGTLCGMMMYTAVVLRKKFKAQELIIVMAVGAFLIGKFDHSIADAFYFTLDGFSLYDAARVFTVAFGNAVGAKILAHTKSKN